MHSFAPHAGQSSAAFNTWGNCGPATHRPARHRPSLGSRCATSERPLRGRDGDCPPARKMLWSTIV
jgi:hypothetical protein